MFQGQSLWVRELDEPGVFELCFDRRGYAINKLDARTIAELAHATQWLAAQPSLRGVLVTSAKDVFIIGADITELDHQGQDATANISADVLASKAILSGFMDLTVPSVVAINGFPLGDGLNPTLSASLRLVSGAAKAGSPRIKLGPLPGFDGTAHLSRLAVPSEVSGWVGNGRSQAPDTAPTIEAGHEWAAPKTLREAARALLRRAMAGDVLGPAEPQRKRPPVHLPAEVREPVHEIPVYETPVLKLTALPAGQRLEAQGTHACMP